MEGIGQGLAGDAQHEKITHRARKVTDLPSIYLRAGHYFLGLEIDKWRRRDEVSISYQAYSGRAIAKARLVLLKPPEELFQVSRRLL